MTKRNHPIIVIEGPDAVGKTTLAEQIHLVSKARYIHLSYARDLLRLWRASLSRALRLSEFAPVVIDRHWPSEAIYAQVYRGGSSLMFEAFQCDQFMQQLGVLYISCALPTVEAMVEAHARSSGERPEMYQPDERIAHVALGYLKWRRNMAGREDVIDYDYTNQLLPVRQMGYFALAKAYQCLTESKLPREIPCSPRTLVLEHL